MIPRELGPVALFVGTEAPTPAAAADGEPIPSNLKNLQVTLDLGSTEKAAEVLLGLTTEKPSLLLEGVPVHVTYGHLDENNEFVHDGEPSRGTEVSGRYEGPNSVLSLRPRK